MELTDKEKRAKWRVAYVQTIRGKALKLINNARRRSEDKGIEIDLPIEWLMEKLEENKCQITGLPFDLSPPSDEHTRRYNAPSLDRIDKKRGYFVDNTRVVLWAVNCALSEYGTEMMLPILKAMIKGIEDAKPQSASPVSTRHYSKSEEHTKHGTVLAPGSGQDDYYPHYHSGAVHRKDFDHRAQESGGDSLAHRNKKVEPLEGFAHIENNGDSSAEVSSSQIRGQRLFD